MHDLDDACQGLLMCNGSKLVCRELFHSLGRVKRPLTSWSLHQRAFSVKICSSIVHAIQLLKHLYQDADSSFLLAKYLSVAGTGLSPSAPARKTRSYCCICPRPSRTGTIPGYHQYSWRRISEPRCPGSQSTSVFQAICNGRPCWYQNISSK